VNKRNSYKYFYALTGIIVSILIAVLVIVHVHEVKKIPFWCYFVYGGALGLAGFSLWIIITGSIPSITPPPFGSTPLRIFHPAVFFLESWKEIDKLTRRDKFGLPVIIVAVTAAFSLTLVEYFGGRDFLQHYYPRILEGKYGDLAMFGWWSFARTFGYVVIPSFTMLIFPSLSFRNCGLGVKDFWKHLWIYAVLFAIVLPVIIFISFKEDFKNYYPFYDYASRSWFDFLMWEFFYATQFVSLEFFFRGYMIHPLKEYLGSYSIFFMVIPYCMIHYGKPYLEANAAIVAGIVLGTLSLRTGSIWCGCLIHISVALSMDILALCQKGLLIPLLHSKFFG